MTARKTTRKKTTKKSSVRAAPASIFVLKLHRGGREKQGAPLLFQLVPDGNGGVTMTDHRGFHCILNRAFWVELEDPDAITYDMDEVEED